MAEERDRYRDDSIDPQEVFEELERILKSDEFRMFGQGRRLLDFTVKETLAGRRQQLDISRIAQAVFARDTCQRPAEDPIVQIETARVGRKLIRYYELSGRSNALRIVLPRGDYVPHFFTAGQSSEKRVNASSETHSNLADRKVQEKALTYRDLILPIGVPVSIVILIMFAFLQPLRTFVLKSGDLHDWIVGPNVPSVTVEPFSTTSANSKDTQKAKELTASIIQDLSRLDAVEVLSPSGDRAKSTGDTPRMTLQGAIQTDLHTPVLDVRLLDQETGTVAWTARYEIRDHGAENVPYEIARHIGVVAAYYHKRGSSGATQGENTPE